MSKKNEKPKKKGYDFTEVEPKIKAFWEKEKIFKFDPTKKNIYSIDTPPPTVSGTMHIGHAFSYSQQDFIARFRRMKQGVFYPFGTDDNGLPTERLVEKIKKVKSKDMSRADFIKRCLKTIKEITPDFTEDWKRIGVSADYDICYSTIDDNSRKISQKSFLTLYKNGEIYKAGFPTLWCPECQTSIAQAELEDKEKTTDLIYIKAKVEDGSFIIYATTRPELHTGCIGISINENGTYVKAKTGSEEWTISKDALETIKDEFNLKKSKEFKGKEIIGKKVEIPFSQQTVEISHDISAKTEYGTGVVYYCSYGGLDCIQWLGRHPKAKAIHVMSKNGRYTTEPIKGLKSPEAREKIIKLLEEKGLLIKKEKMNHAVNTHDKCGTDVEFIATPQWFIKVIDKKKELIKQGKKINWSPKHMFKRYENWIKGLEWDWSISRDRHFGIPIPVWTCEKCNEIILPEESELPIDPLQIKKKCPKCNKEATPESKVLDTWATSSMTPQITSSLVSGKIKIPYSLRPQAHDIIRTWAFYTIVKSFYHENEIPWENVMVSGFVTLKGEKMSKSKGNVVAPQSVIENYGADPLRFWAAGSKLGEDLDYQEQDLVTGKKTVTKLWNASKFAFMNLKDYNSQKPKKLEKIDELFLKELNRVVFTATHRFENCEYSRAKFNSEEFFWKDFCDNYLEIIKKRIYQGKGDKKLSAQYTLRKSLLTILKLIAPIMPFITEEIYQTYYRKYEKDKSIHISEWPKYDKKKLEQWSEKDAMPFANKWFLLKDLISKIRRAKTNAQKSMNSEITLTLPREDQKSIEDMIEDFKSVVNTKEIKEGKFKVEFN
jgi:valyl-tRNA synthetase